MGLSVIGAGFGRTGTLSLKGALEQLGFGPCHHMLEVVENPGQLPLWQRVAAGETVDWEAVFDGYRACVDWPSAFFWRELAEFYPEAKVVLTTRDVDAWYKSYNDTILALVAAMDRIADPHLRATLEMGGSIVGPRVFDGRPHEPEHAKAVFRNHLESVRAALPADRLLVFDVREGWESLCAFLGVAVPETPFPRLNDTEQFKAVLSG